MDAEQEILAAKMYAEYANFVWGSLLRRWFWRTYRLRLDRLVDEMWLTQ